MTVLVHSVFDVQRNTDVPVTAFRNVLYLNATNFDSIVEVEGGGKLVCPKINVIMMIIIKSREDVP